MWRLWQRFRIYRECSRQIKFDKKNGKIVEKLTKMKYDKVSIF